MRSAAPENVMEHSQLVAVIAHALAVINNRVFGGNADKSLVVLYAVYHEASEALTGDLPTPIKYFNENIKKAYKDIEAYANGRLLAMLPAEFRPDYEPLIRPDTASLEYALLKGADKLAAYVKCLEETGAGNREFETARQTIKKDLENSPLPEVRYFYDRFLPGFTKTLDEI
jgi:5'-deoxynucleotidase